MSVSLFLGTAGGIGSVVNSTQSSAKNATSESLEAGQGLSVTVAQLVREDLKSSMRLDPGVAGTARQSVTQSSPTGQTDTQRANPIPSVNSRGQSVGRYLDVIA